jgi:hypothetical protein
MSSPSAIVTTGSPRIEDPVTSDLMVSFALR